MFNEIKEKEEKPITVSPQVYGRAEPSKATEIGRFMNAACTFMHVVVDLFTGRFGFPCKSRAHLCQGNRLAKSIAFSAPTDAAGHVSFTTGSLGTLGHHGRGV